MMPRLSRFRFAMLAGTALVLPGVALAQSVTPGAAPVLDRVVAGGITVQQQAGQTVVQQPQQRGIVEWRSFNVGRDHHVQFQQPGASAITLNRVTTPDPSVIAGRITANGQVAIVNQSGVVFTQGAQVNVAGLVVSSANITNENFMAGRMVFDQPGRPDARIENAGSITVREAGLAALVAPQVANRGTITARLGRVALAGAETHVVDLHGDGLLSIEVTGAVRQAPSGATALVTNTGVIEATGGTVQLTAAAADGIVQDLVRAGGRIAADTDAATGRTGLVAIHGTGGAVRVEGEVRATGAAPGTRGGRIEVVADRVLVDRGARVDASGTVGGGEIGIGTTLRGSSTPRLARRTGIADGATVRADATQAGRGGTVIVNSQDYTGHGGAISARGGPQGGDGGFVEVSGQRGLLVLGTIDTSAPAGAPGTILIDPIDLRIVEEGVTPPGFDPASLTGNVLEAADPPDNAFLWPSQFQNLVGDVLLQASSDITVETPINRVGGGLTLDAGRDITVSAPITGDGNVTLTAGRDIVANSFFIVDGALTLDAGRNVLLDQGLGAQGAVDIIARTGSITIGEGGITGGGAAFSAVAAGAITVDATVSGFQGITLSAAAGTVLLNPNSALIDDAGGPGVTILAGDAIRINGGERLLGHAITTTELLDLQAGAGGITQTGGIRAGTLQVRTAGDAVLDLEPVAPRPMNEVGTLADSDVAGAFTLRSTELGTAGQPLTVTGLVRVGGRLTLEPMTGVTQAAPSVIATPEIVVNTPRDITLAGDNAIQAVAGMTAGQFLTLRNIGTLTIAGPVTVDNNGGFAGASIAVEQGDLLIAAPVLVRSGETFAFASLSAEGNLTLAAAGSVTADGISGGFVDLSAATGPLGFDPLLPGALTLAGDVTATPGNVRLQAGQGGILQTAGGITTDALFVGSGGEALLRSPGNAVAELAAVEVAGNFLLDNGSSDLLITTGPPSESFGVAASIAIRTAGAVFIEDDAELTGTGPEGRLSFRVGDLGIGIGATVSAPVVEIAPFDIRPVRLPVEDQIPGELGILGDTLARLGFQTLRVGATTFEGVLTTTASAVILDAPLTIPGTLDLRSLGTVTQVAGAGLTAGTLTGQSGGSTLLLEPGNGVATLAGFAAGGDFRLLSQGPQLAVPGGTTVFAGGALGIEVAGGGLLVDGTVTGAETTLLAGTALTVNGFSAIARIGTLLMQAPSVTLAGLAAAGGNIVVEAPLAASLAGFAQTSGALIVASPSVTFGGLSAGSANVLVNLGSAGFAQGAITAGELRVQGGRGAVLTGTIAGIAGPAAAARGSRANPGGVPEPDPPPNQFEFTFNGCPIGTALCGLLFIPLPLENPPEVLAVLEPGLLAAMDQLRPPTPDLRLQPARDPGEENELAPPDIRAGDY
ncbi:filamentous hemagglutinin N-terminal domain-containing protein [Roseomonas alkaliterrae]|uniref:Filamentous hemagglutinin family protein n=2 Tax=Neoroseomonas alkaliterrae TaxID=1452450 RepID=A0A840YAG8_9PROT|nr:filamentous hemagglutinin N-terminal domain-containing protein [Neoroseomonas alkaliterrae]MBB5691542.1 filamentous hemagglutinin family protein [Neoroseomonas alkaliterrae]MBR0676597.1 filamentous hemagglutinin N-terminal domain-containing protein [Neoroseomonas alkaliterrae]